MGLSTGGNNGITFFQGMIPLKKNRELTNIKDIFLKLSMLRRAPIMLLSRMRADNKQDFLMPQRYLNGISTWTASSDDLMKRASSCDMN